MYRSDSYQSNLSILEHSKKQMHQSRHSISHSDYPYNVPVTIAAPVIPSEVSRENLVYNNVKSNFGGYDVKTLPQPWIGARKTPDQQALEIGMLLSQQESQFGINMYDSLTPADEPEIANLTNLGIDLYLIHCIMFIQLPLGYSSDEAILMIFERRYKAVPANLQMNIAPASRYVDARSSVFNNNNRPNQHIRHHTTSSMPMTLQTNIPQMSSPVAIPRALPFSPSV